VQCRTRATWIATPWVDTFEGQQATAAALLAAADELPDKEEDDKEEEVKEEETAVAVAIAVSPKLPLHCVLQRIDLLSARGFLTIFREPLNNALDNSSKPDSLMTYIKSKLESQRHSCAHI